MSIRTLRVSASVSVKDVDDADLGAAAASAELSNRSQAKPGPLFPCKSSLNVRTCNTTNIGSLFAVHSKISEKLIQRHHSAFDQPVYHFSELIQVSLK